jgi:hypothetical protein
LRLALLKAYEDKMKIIEKLKRSVTEENLDPSFNTIFRSLNIPDFRDIPREVSKNIAVSMHHYQWVEKQFNSWHEDNKRKKPTDVKYPIIELEPPKDDVIQYSENW